VRSKAAGERVLKSVTEFLSKRLRLKVNEAKSAVARPWERKFLGYSMTWHKAKPRLKVAPESVTRLKGKIRTILREGRGRKLTTVIQDLNALLRGWMQYFRLTEVKGVLEELDGWLRRKLRCLLWRQWKRPFTRAKNLMKRGLEKLRSWQSTTNGHGPWWNAGASHMNEAFPKSFFDRLGLISLLDQYRQLQFSN
jgi:RNA-directed DNA polymerase